MSARRLFARCTPPMLGLLVVAMTLPAWGGGVGFRSSAVGGVLVDAEGVLSNAELDDLGTLRQIRLTYHNQDVPADLKQPAKLRKVSLRGLQEAHPALGARPHPAAHGS